MIRVMETAAAVFGGCWLASCSPVCDKSYTGTFEGDDEGEVIIITGGQVDLRDCSITGSFVSEAGAVGDVYGRVNGSGGSIYNFELVFDHGSVCSNADADTDLSGYLDENRGDGTWSVSCEDESFYSSGTWSVFE